LQRCTPLFCIVITTGCRTAFVISGAYPDNSKQHNNIDVKACHLMQLHFLQGQSLSLNKSGKSLTLHRLHQQQFLGFLEMLTFPVFADHDGRYLTSSTSFSDSLQF